MDDALNLLLNLPNGILVLMLLIAGVVSYFLWKNKQKRDDLEKKDFKRSVKMAEDNIISIKGDINKKVDEIKLENNQAFNDMNLKLHDISSENKFINRDIKSLKVEHDKETQEIKVCQKDTDKKVERMDKRLVVVEHEAGITKK